MRRIDEITISSFEYQSLTELEQQEYVTLFTPTGLRYIKKKAVENA